MLTFLATRKVSIAGGDSFLGLRRTALSAADCCSVSIAGGDSFLGLRHILHFEALKDIGFNRRWRFFFGATWQNALFGVALELFQSQVAILFWGYTAQEQHTNNGSRCFNRRWRFFFGATFVISSPIVSFDSFNRRWRFFFGATK